MIRIWTTTLVILGTLPLARLGAAEGDVLSVAQLHRLDLLPRLKSSVFVGTVSSYDRTGGNDDGFSGKYSFVAKEPDGLVIADLQGPGVVYRIWTPTPSDDWFEFFFDGETEPRIRVKFRDIFTGSAAPFVAPLVGFGAGGYYCYVPLPFEKSCRIVARAERVQFYQINYARYAADAPIETWSANVSPEYLEHQAQAQQLFAASGRNLSSRVVPAGASIRSVKTGISLAPGAAATLFETDTGGRIAGIRISPTAALAGKGRDLVLRVTWDNGSQPAILCPVGDFFGFAWGRPATRSLLVGSAEGTSYCYFPMPFDQSARIEVLSDRSEGPPVELQAEIDFCPVARQPDEAKFYAVWRRENPTTKGEPFTFVETKGRGHLVGCLLQAQGMVSGNTYFFEGDDETTIDGQMTIHGTGSEDFFNGGWYDVPDRWEKRLSFPLSGCLGYQKHLGRTGGYRLMLGDAYAFRKSLKQAIEHAPTGNDLETDYVGVTFLYLASDTPLVPTLPPVGARRVTDFSKIVFTPAWSVPIRAFTFRGANLTKMDEEIDGKKASFLRMTATGQDWFGPPFISLECDIPAAGRYRVSIEAVQGPGQSVVQLFRNEVPAGDAVDLYSPERRASAPLSLGVLELEEGPATFTFKLVRKNEQSTGLGLDLMSVICERID